MNLPSQIIHVYTFCKNEVDIIPFFLSYYKGIAQKIVVYDNESTDGSIELIDKEPMCERRTFKTNNKMRDDILMFIKNSAWKESIGKADWVVVCDMDEFLHHEDLVNQLTIFKRKGISIPTVVGYNMISNFYPEIGTQITEQIKWGAYSKEMSKKIIFDPNKISEINYEAGGHSINPEGQVKYCKQWAGFKLLHYKYIGDLNRLEYRWTKMGDSLSQINIENKWAIERTNSALLIERHKYVNKNAELVIGRNFSGLRSRLYHLFKIRNKKTYC